LIAGWFANKKNNELTAANATSDSHAAAASAMASVIQAQPALVTAAMNAATSNGSTAAVATHLQSAASPT
jgi:Tfp pilus assembly protein PilW